MAAFYGVERKLAIVVLTILMVGWLTYLIGFISLSIQTKEEEHDILFWIPWVVAAIGGPLLCIFALIQAGLPRLASAIVGSVTALIGNLFIISTGFNLCSSGIMLFEAVLIESGLGLQAALGSIFTGLVICVHCWSVISSLSILYKDSPTEPTVPSSRVTRGRLFEGVARKLTIPTTILSFIGWLILLSGLFTAKDSFQGFPEGLPAWGVLFFGILVHLFYLVHAGSWGGASTAVGIAASFFGSVYSVVVGYFLFVYLTQPNSTERSLTISGSVLSCFFVTLVLMLWPFYKRLGVRTTQSNPHSSNTIQANEAQPLLDSASENN